MMTTMMMMTMMKCQSLLKISKQHRKKIEIWKGLLFEQIKKNLYKHAYNKYLILYKSLGVLFLSINLKMKRHPNILKEQNF